MFIIIAITGVKMFNVMHKGKLYDKTYVWAGFIGFWVFYLLQFITTMAVIVNGAEETIILNAVLLKFANFFILVNVCFFIAEILFNLGWIGVEGIESYKSNSRA